MNMKRTRFILIAAVATLGFAGMAAAEDKKDDKQPLVITVPVVENLKPISQKPGIASAAASVPTMKNLKTIPQSTGALTAGQAGLSEHLNEQFLPLRMAAKQQRDFMAIVSKNLSRQLTMMGGVGPQVGYGTIMTRRQQREFSEFVSNNLSRQLASTPKPPVSVAALHAAEAAPLLRQSVVRDAAD
jgi:hypothetical protein